jgi:hypothetical protein
MDIRYRKEGRNKWVVEVWTKNEMPGWEEFDEPLPEEVYLEINRWCRDTLGYYPRTAYHIFEFKKRSDLNWFLMRWN